MSEENIHIDFDPDNAEWVPNVDLSTVSTIECGNYRVRIAKLFDGRYYAAVVAMRNVNQISVALTKLTTGGDGEWSSVEETTHETHAQKYVAIGTAIESFLDMGDDDE